MWSLVSLLAHLPPFWILIRESRIRAGHCYHDMDGIEVLGAVCAVMVTSMFSSTHHTWSEYSRYSTLMTDTSVCVFFSLTEHPPPRFNPAPSRASRTRWLKETLFFNEPAQNGHVTIFWSSVFLFSNCVFTILHWFCCWFRFIVSFPLSPWYIGVTVFSIMSVLKKALHSRLQN